MARTRNLKPAFFLNEQLAELPALTRLLFEGLWCHADREGRLEDRPKKLKAAILPYDDFDVDAALTALHDSGLVLRYRNCEASYIQVLTFLSHQNPHVREPTSTIPAPDKNSASTRPAPGEHSESTVTAALDPNHLPLTTNHKDKDLDLDHYTDPQTMGHKRQADKRDKTHRRRLRPDSQDFYEFKVAYPPRNGAQRWVRAKQAINARLKQGHTWAEITAGARRYAQWCTSTGKTNTEHVMQAATFCGPDKPFLEPWDLPSKTTGQNTDAEPGRCKIDRKTGRRYDTSVPFAEEQHDD